MYIYIYIYLYLHTYMGVYIGLPQLQPRRHSAGGPPPPQCATPNKFIKLINHTITITKHTKRYYTNI